MPRGSPRLRTPDGKQNQTSDRIQGRRLELRMSQDTLCARVALVTNGGWIPGRRDIYRIESGTRIVADMEVVALARALDCNPCWLLLGETV